ncbi:MAG TPA: acyltransferase family protein [Roseiflexaceae bacterium]|nr:acyltransferase family protein [Roseiflexaceae bacterium]
MAIVQLAPAIHLHEAMATHSARLVYVDNLRAIVIGVVIVHHAAQAYGPTGGEWPIFNPTRAAILEPFFTVNLAFGLGLLFLIAGYFVPRAYDRKGAVRFLVDRLVRLGVPMLFVSLVLFPLFMYAMDARRQSFIPFLAGYLRQPLALHMWFVGYLLLASGGYAGWRWLTKRAAPVALRPAAAPRHREILGYALALGLATFVARIWFPVDRWVSPLPLISIEPAHVPQYLSLFILGIMAERRDWLRQLPSSTGMAWLRVGLAAAMLPYAAAVLRELTPINIDLGTDGGLNLMALVSSAIEALIAVGLCVGLLTLFRDRFDCQSVLARELAAGSYAVYVIHVFPVVALQLALAASPLPPLAKFGVVALVAVPLCFGLAYALRRLPGVRRII